MKMYLISDNIDTLTGMRLAGVDGIVVHEREELRWTMPLLIEIPDRHGTGRKKDFITSYVNEAIGLKL